MASGDKMVLEDSCEKSEVPPVLVVLTDFSGIDKSTYSGRIKLDMYSTRRKSQELYIIKKIHTVMNAWWNIRGEKIKIWERDGGSGKITCYSELATEYQELDRYVEVIHRYHQSGYHYISTTTNKSVGGFKGINR